MGVEFQFYQKCGIGLDKKGIMESAEVCLKVVEVKLEKTKNEGMLYIFELRVAAAPNNFLWTVNRVLRID